MVRGRDESGVTVGVIGQASNATVSPWGAVSPWGGPLRDVLDWAIAADDRWHLPASEAAVRQHRLGGTPVVETRVRVPDGDAVQRVWSVPDWGGMTVIEVENDSPLPFAVSFFGCEVMTERPPADVPVQGIELAGPVTTMPVGHHSMVRVAISHGTLPADADPRAAPLSSLAGSTSVAAGWQRVTGQASRLDVPDESLVNAFIEARCDVLLNGPVDRDDDPVGFVLDAAELVRCGSDAEAWLLELVAPLERAARLASQRDPELGAALERAQRVAIAAHDDRARADIERMSARIADTISSPALTGWSDVRRSSSVGRFVASVEHRIANGPDMLPLGIPSAWLGVNFEVHDVPTSADSAVSFAVRWHGDRPAVLWQQSGRPRRLTACAVDAHWSSTEATGEALWERPLSARRLPLNTATAGEHERILPTEPPEGSTISFG